MDTRPQIVQPLPIKREASSTPSNLPTTTTGGGGLPANPLTGRVPSTSASNYTGGMQGQGTMGNGQLTACFISDMHWVTSLSLLSPLIVRELIDKRLRMYSGLVINI